MLRLALMLAPGPALAHAGERGFVLLMPTAVWSAAGVAVVALTALALALVPPRWLAALFRARRLISRPALPGAQALSLCAATLLAALVATGFLGSRDPLANLLPLSIWTLWWVGFTLATACLGDLWRGANPFTGPHALLRRRLGAPRLRLPAMLGAWPAVALMLAFGWFELIHPAPDDPAILARAVGLYWLGTLLALALFGEGWLRQGEPFGIFLRVIAGLAPVWSDRQGGRVVMRCGFPGARLLAAPAPRAAEAALVLLALATVTFDGLSETFWWLSRLGLNPLEFPGRSAVAQPNAAGLVAAWALLAGAFAVAVALGARLGGAPLAPMLARQALALAPIAIGYHLAHYLSALLVNGQYALLALGELLGVGHGHVTTGFLYDPDAVRRLWLTQAGAIVLGHVVAVLMSHRATLALTRDARAAAWAQAPLSALMTLYTLLGLWLLSQPLGA